MVFVLLNFKKGIFISYCFGIILILFLGYSIYKIIRIVIIQEEISNAAFNSYKNYINTIIKESDKNE